MVLEIGVVVVVVVVDTPVWRCLYAARHLFPNKCMDLMLDSHIHCIVTDALSCTHKQQCIFGCDDGLTVDWRLQNVIRIS